MNLTTRKAAGLAYFSPSWPAYRGQLDDRPPRHELRANGPCLVPVLPWSPQGGPLMAPSGVSMVGIALVLRDLVQRGWAAWRHCWRSWPVPRCRARSRRPPGAGLDGSILAVGACRLRGLHARCRSAGWCWLCWPSSLVGLIADSLLYPQSRLRQPRIPRRPDSRQDLDGAAGAAVRAWILASVTASERGRGGSSTGNRSRVRPKFQRAWLWGKER